MLSKYAKSVEVEAWVLEALYIFARKCGYVPIMLRFYGGGYLLKHDLCDERTLAQHLTIDGLNHGSSVRKTPNEHLTPAGASEDLLYNILLNAGYMSDLLGNFTSKEGYNYVCFWCKKACDTSNTTMEEFVTWYNSTIQNIFSVLETHNWNMLEVEAGVNSSEFTEFLTFAFEGAAIKKFGVALSFDFYERDGKVLLDTCDEALVRNYDNFNNEAIKLFYSDDMTHDLLYVTVQESPVWDTALYERLPDNVSKCAYWTAAYKVMKIQKCINFAYTWLKELGLWED